MHPAEHFLRTYAELYRLDRRIARADIARLALCAPACALNIVIVALGGALWFINLLAACLVALSMQRVWLWRLERRTDLQRLTFGAWAALEYLQPTTREIRIEARSSEARRRA